jgi:hypothetical protein
VDGYGRSVGTGADLVHIVAVPPRPQRRVLDKILFVGSLIDLLAGRDVWGWGVREDGGGSTEILVRYQEREHRLFKESSFDVAKQKCDRVAHEYEEMPRREWCERYRVPESFFGD